MADSENERAMMFTLLAKSLDILGELVSTTGDPALAAMEPHVDGLRQTIGSATYVIKDSEVTISSHSRHEGLEMTGDIFNNIGQGATIINRSFLSNSMNKLQDGGQADIADALKRVAEVIEQSGNSEAAENFDAMTQELAQPVPRKAILKTLWAGTVAALPVIADMTDVVEKVAGLFS
ncbi:hypothetical protein ACFYO8_00065 [Micromonospora sp. NPDC005257]|uniref:hypothetical protein n=1 Tax=Micromonospora sp. NPDC005257 TaxID=3364230 RepID=UPI0036A09D75